MVTPEGSWDRSKPWTIPADTLVLYRTDREWRFAVGNVAGGIIDGHLIDTPVDAPVAAAMVRTPNRTRDASVVHRPLGL